MDMNEKMLLIVAPLVVGLLIGIVASIAIVFSLKKKAKRWGGYYHEVDHTGDGFIDGYE